MSHQMWKKIANEFAVKWQFPNCIGAIDGKHVSIQVSDFLEFKNLKLIFKTLL